MKWFDRVTGLLLIIFGIAMIIPGAFLLLSPLFGFYTVGLTPHWLPYALYALSILGIVQVIGGVNSIRGAGIGE